MTKVDLVSVTPNAEALIVKMARVSNPSNAGNMETAPRLVSYLIRKKHWSPFEMAHLTVEICTSRAIAAQILRHRSFTFQEFSQRYAAVEEGFELYPARRQDKANRQNSIDDLSEEIKAAWEHQQRQLGEQAVALYEWALNNGIAKECARMVLPLSCPTRLYMSGSLRSWIHYIELRADAATQLEHREVAEGCKKIFTQELPLITEALGW